MYMVYQARKITMPHWISVLVLVSVISLALVGVRVCVAIVSHSMQQCQDCAASMSAVEHLSWWQDQLLGVTVPSSEIIFMIMVAAALIILIVPAIIEPRQLAYAWYRRQRFRPPQRDYLSALLADGILNPKIFFSAR